MQSQTIYVTVLASLIGLGFSSSRVADDPENLVRKAAERCTLNQPGTKPFHLRATLAPSFERDRPSNRTGEVEFWWASPSQWKREVRSPEFHQVAIVNGQKEWQKNEEEYFPEWLREISVALIEPIPALDEVLKHVEESDAKTIMGMANFSWSELSSDGNVEKGMGAALSIDNKGLIQFGGGLGWSGGYRDYKSFHNRMVARTVTSGGIEVTAKVAILEDLANLAPDFFDATAAGGDPTPLKTIRVEEPTLRKNLLPVDPVVWPALKDGPLEGVVTTSIVVDRSGNIRELGSILSDNPGLSESAGRAIGAMRFKPYLQDGVPVQVISRITMPFKSARPASMENFDSARNYFERGRHVSFPAFGKGQPYVLRATFQTRLAEKLEEGQYVDTWKGDDDWRREATIAKSRYVRARHGETRYLLAEGPDAAVLGAILKVMEPIPALDTFVESDWRINRDTMAVAGVNTIRVLAGHETPAGVLDPEQARGYWFDEKGRLLKTFFRGIETRRSDFQEFGDFQIAHTIAASHNGVVLLVIRVTDISPAPAAPDNIFQLKGHEWRRAFTDEVR